MTTPAAPASGSILDAVKFDDKGLLSVIVQDADTDEVLMFAFMNREALEMTLRDRKACYYSRSRKKLWLKGETSGHMQSVVEVRLDCDGDALLLKVRQEGGACHTGYRSCFYRREDEGRWCEDGEKVFQPEDVYKPSPASE